MPQKKKKEQERARKQQQWKREDEQIKAFRAKAPHIKVLLRGRGCVLPFYDYLDSYSDEFHRIATAAKAAHPSLLGVHEVDADTFDDRTGPWPQLGYSGLRQLVFDMKEEVADYGQGPRDANLCGSMTSFHDADGSLRSVILIRQSVKASLQHSEWKYAFKVASLLHEVGHVDDLERGINFDVDHRRLDVIEAEVYAHLFALDRLAQRNLFQSFNMYVGGLRDAIPKGGYIRDVAQRVLDKLPTYNLANWHEALEAPPTPEELKRLGPKGVEAISKP